MVLKKHIRNLAMHSSVFRELIFRVRGSILKRKMKRKYGSMSRKGIFENIYSNFTWGAPVSTIQVKALTQRFM